MNQLGDLLFSLPVLKAARLELKSKIYSVIKADLAPLLISSGLVDNVISKDDNIIKVIQKVKFDKAIFFSESPRTLVIALFSKIKEKIGFDSLFFNLMLTKQVKRVGVPSLFNNRNLGVVAGLKTIQYDYTNILNIPKENLSNIEQWFNYNNLDASKTIAVSIGSSKRRKCKCLEENKWIEIINILSDRGLNCVLSGVKSEFFFE
jgi:ADP-heptose:LPS heptosyltransferase